MSDVFLRQLGLPRPDLFLGVGSGTHGEQTARALAGIELALLEHRPALVVVSGDVNSTLAGALAAVKLEIPVAHLEAGLRSFDRSMPEEHNRRLTDHMSSLLLAHSESAVENLAAEGIDRGLVHLVGNTMIDSLLEHVGAARLGTPWRAHGLEPGGYGLVTLHRPALVDQPERLRETVVALAELGRETPLVFPLHPRTLDRLSALELLEGLEEAHVAVTPPLSYLDFLGLEAEARFVLTDSGGVQEETSALGVACFTLRPNTERPITVTHGSNQVVGTDTGAILAGFRRAMSPAGAVPRPDLWDGHTAERIARVLCRFLSN